MNRRRRRGKQGGTAQMTQKSSLEKALSVFDLFESDRLEWSLEEIAAEIGVATSTCYRYMRLLAKMGFVVASPSGHFSIGPRISLLEMHMRRRDALIRLAEPHAEALIERWPGAALVSRAFRDRLICIFRAQSPLDERRIFNRGHEMPMVRGAHARVLQAWLSRHRLTKLYRAHEDDFRTMDGCETLESFFRSLRQVRRARVWLEGNTYRPGSVGVCAPILDARQGLVGAFSLTFAMSAVDEADHPKVADDVRASAEAIGRALEVEAAREAAA
jgi:DNA-binding IclR family transcriptional regulator